MISKIMLAVLVAFLLILLMLLNGWVFAMLWSWFAVPLLGAPPIGVAGALGLSLLVQHIVYRAPPKNDEREWTEQFTEICILSLSRSLVALAIGVLLRGFLPGAA